ncbi:hypothetical protein CHLRE_16g688901v5 [Chlamydomonas reinhardtii]|uniref:guanylate cyclase n=1 Tax=Chlamydomonas reinhardtii TaxID=3055 RepID=A0A2K3CU48_CHLRE|nr:uncharacterized protein CHLRE_16g688901v5 [Chlamydomonas reinhardtii]PNW71807.1 hypothetical protein CHLRE_16g688901v5 [Chlamydomonas reinhardtii]
MIGIINEAAKLFVLDSYGQEVWDKIVETTGVDPHFISGCPYADEQTYKILGAVAELKGEALGDVMEAAGLHFNTVYIVKRGYDRLLRCMGGNLVEFLQNLNVYHLHLSVTFKEMNPPAFNVSEVTPQSLIFHYASQRPGLTRFAMGLIRGAARTLFDTEVDVSVLQLRDEPAAAPPPAAAVADAAAAATCAAGAGAAGPGPCESAAGVPLCSAEGCSTGLAGPRGSESGEYELRTSAPAAAAPPTPPPPLDHDKLLVLFPHQPSVHHHAATASSCRLAIDPATLFKLFPFHIAFDSECRIVQVGRALLRMYPGMKPGRRLSEFFTLRHPYFEMSFERVKERLDSVFVLKALCNGMELKGQMTHMLMPAGTGDHNPARSYTRMVVPPTGLEVIHSALARMHEPGTSGAASAHGASSYYNAAPESTVASLTGSLACPHMASLSQQQQQQTRFQGQSQQPTLPLHLLAPSVAMDLLGTSTGTGQDTGSAFLATKGTGTGTGTGGFMASGGGCGGANPLSSRSSSFGSLGGGGHSSQLCGGSQSQGAGGGRGLEPVMLFLGSPRIGNVDELRTYGLYVSDLPLFDNSREMILSMEQRTAEAALKDSFERLSMQLEEERHRTQQLLYQMIPRRIADVLRSGERFEAETYHDATILFSDIVGFTTISAGSTAMEVCNMLDELYNEFDALLESDKYKALYKVETIGDAYMLVANVTEPCVEHVDVMCDFALDMARVCSRVKTNRGQPLEIRVGIHTGSVVGGIVGRRMPRFHLFGDTVNTASRMESHGVPGSVHISGASRRFIRHPQRYLITERGEISVKGKGLMETFLVSRADNPTTAHIRAIVASSAEKLPCLSGAASRLPLPYPHPASAQARVAAMRRVGSFVSRGTKPVLAPSPAHGPAALAMEARGSNALTRSDGHAGAGVSVSAGANVQLLPPQQQPQLHSPGSSGAGLAGLHVLCGGGDGGNGDTGGAMSPMGLLSPRGPAAPPPQFNTRAPQAAATAAAVEAAQSARAAHAAAVAAAAAGGIDAMATVLTEMQGSPAMAFGGTFSVGRPRQPAAALQDSGDGLPAAKAALVAAMRVDDTAAGASRQQHKLVSAGGGTGGGGGSSTAMESPRMALASQSSTHNGTSASPQQVQHPHPAPQHLQHPPEATHHQEQPDLLHLLPTLQLHLPPQLPPQLSGSGTTGPGTSRFAPSGASTPPVATAAAAAAGGGGGLASMARDAASSGPGTPTADGDLAHTWRLGPDFLPVASKAAAGTLAVAAGAARVKATAAGGATIGSGTCGGGAMSPLVLDQGWDGLLQGLADLDDASREELSAAAAATAAAAAAWRQQQQNLKQQLRRILTPPGLPTLSAAGTAAATAASATAPGCSTASMPPILHGAGSGDFGGGTGAGGSASWVAGPHARAFSGLLIPGAATPPGLSSPRGPAGAGDGGGLGSQARRRMARARKPSFVLAVSPVVGSVPTGGGMEQALDLLEADVLEMLAHASSSSALGPAATAAWPARQSPPPFMPHPQAVMEPGHTAAAAAAGAQPPPHGAAGTQQQLKLQVQQQLQLQLQQHYVGQLQQLQQFRQAAAPQQADEATGVSLSFHLPHAVQSAAPFPPGASTDPAQGGDGAQVGGTQEDWYADAYMPAEEEEGAEEEEDEEGSPGFHGRHRLARRHLTDDLQEENDDEAWYDS